MTWHLENVRFEDGGTATGSFTVNTAGAHCSPASCTSGVPYFDVTTTTGQGSGRFGFRYASYANEFNGYPNVADVGITEVLTFLGPNGQVSHQPGGGVGFSGGLHGPTLQLYFTQSLKNATSVPLPIFVLGPNVGYNSSAEIVWPDSAFRRVISGTITSIPEPSEFFFLTLGLAALVGMTYRRRKYWMVVKEGEAQRTGKMNLTRSSALVCAAAALSLAVGSASATLLDRGPDLVYDDVLNITWTRNANLAGSSELTWGDANTWAANLVFGGFDDWRLPYGSVRAGVGLTATVVECATASEVACRDNEMGYMYYYDLGGSRFVDNKTGTQTATSRTADRHSALLLFRNAK